MVRICITDKETLKRMKEFISEWGLICKTREEEGKFYVSVEFPSEEVKEGFIEEISVPAKEGKLTYVKFN